MIYYRQYISYFDGKGLRILYNSYKFQEGRNFNYCRGGSSLMTQITSLLTGPW